MKIVIPENSIIILPKGNSKDMPMTNPEPLEVDAEDVEQWYPSWEDYRKCQGS